MPRMNNRASFPFACIRTLLVLVFLVAGMLGGTTFRPQVPASPRAEQLQLPLLHLASAAAKDRVRMPRSDQAAAACGNAADDACTTVSGQLELLPESRDLLLAAPRAPPACARKHALAYRTRAPPRRMI